MRYLASGTWVVWVLSCPLAETRQTLTASDQQNICQKCPEIDDVY